MLAAGQEEVARGFATKQSGEEKLAGVPHDLVEGMPVLHGVLAWLVCGLGAGARGRRPRDPGRRPLEAGGDQDAQPLFFFGGRFQAPPLESV